MPVTVSMLEKCISNLKRNKATCLDNISSEHLLHAGPHINNVHLSLLFNSIIRHCFVPSEFFMGIIHPLFKNKHGDATDINRLCIVVLRSHQWSLRCLSQCCYSYMTIFLPVIHCNMGLYSCTVYCWWNCEILHKKRIKSLYCSFLDASKAFDKVLHNGIFKKLLDRGIPVSFVKLLRYWYVAHLSRTEVPWVGSTSGATVANVSNIDVFEVGANIVLLS